MKTIGIGVEGPSDRMFWDRVLRQNVRSLRFDIRNMKNRDKLIRATPELLDEFHKRGHAAGFILLDADDDPCIPAIRERFEPAVQAEFQKPQDKRFLHLCAAFRSLECWYLADQTAVRNVTKAHDFAAPEDTDGINGTAHIKRLIRAAQGKNVSYNKIDFALLMGTRFSPSRAVNCSSSFAYFWKGLTEAKTK